LSVPQPGPYYSTWGPMDGPIRRGDCPAIIEVVGAAGPGAPVVGEAEVVGVHPDPGGSVAIFRLRIGGDWLSGLWECRGRQFVRWPVPTADGRGGG
jgi:hypothetical protein